MIKSKGKTEKIDNNLSNTNITKKIQDQNRPHINVILKTWQPTPISDC